jgi:REP element-mobilizing transposase RayT
MNRGSGRRTVFANDDERRLFLGLLAEAGECTGVETHAYCLMGNHFHLLLRSADGSLSEAMKQLSSGYTRRVNTWRGVDGSIFRGRFNSVLVEEVEHLRQLCRYIHRNPVEAGLVGSARQYRWSSCRALIGDRRPPAFLHTATVLGWFGDRPEQFLAFVDDPEVPDPEFVPVDHDLRVGDHSGVGGAASVPGLDHLERWVEVEFGCDPGHIRSVVSGSRNLARLALMLTAIDDLRLSPTELADAFGVAPGTVRSNVARARRRREADPAFDAAVAAIERRLGRRAA